MNKLILCKICDSAYIETKQKNIEYVCSMCRDNILNDNDKRVLPKQNIIKWDEVKDCGNI